MLGNLGQEQDALWQAAVNLLQQGLTPEQINEMLGTDFDLSGMIGGDTETITDRALTRQIDAADKTSQYMQRQNELTQQQTITLSTLLQQLVYNTKNGGIGVNPNNVSASNIKRDLNYIDRVTRQ
jgi:ethanolamine ammonia-lyase large subunit